MDAPFTLFIFRFFIYVGQYMMIMVQWQKLHIGLSFVEMVQFLTNKFLLVITLKIRYHVIKQKPSTIW